MRGRAATAPAAARPIPNWRLFSMVLLPVCFSRLRLLRRSRQQAEGRQMLFDLGLQPGWVAIDEGGAIALMLVDDIGEFRALRGLDGEQDQHMARDAGPERGQQRAVGDLIEGGMKGDIGPIDPTAIARLGRMFEGGDG